MVSTSKYFKQIPVLREKLPELTSNFSKLSRNQVQRTQGKLKNTFQKGKTRLSQKLMNIRHYPDLSAVQEGLIRQKQKLANNIFNQFQTLNPLSIVRNENIAGLNKDDSKTIIERLNGSNEIDFKGNFKALREKQLINFSQILKTATYSFMYSENDSKSVSIKDINKVSDKLSEQDINDLIILFKISAATYNSTSPTNHSDSRNTHADILEALYKSKEKITSNSDIRPLIQSHELHVEKKDGKLFINQININQGIQEKLPDDLKKLFNLYKSNTYEFTVDNQFNWEEKSDMKVRYQSNKVISHRNQANYIIKNLESQKLAFLENNAEREKYINQFEEILEAEASSFLIHETTNKPERLKLITKVSDRLPLEDINNLISLFNFSSVTYIPNSEYFDSMGTHSIILEALNNSKDKIENNPDISDLIQSQELNIEMKNNLLFINGRYINNKIKKKLPESLITSINQQSSNNISFIVKNRFYWDIKNEAKNEFIYPHQSIKGADLSLV
ncbi:MAG: hypothetical protein HRT47_10255 [Candidatus Caenarcaniphilales bacterium]|nr:hypothetical protein [Candidatus Caenarcaniphilales bacterium]